MSKKTTLFLLITMAILVTTGISKAQINIGIGEIKKITLVDKVGGMGGWHRAEFEITKLSGVWKCYQTKLEYHGWAFAEARDGKDYTKLNTDKRIFIKNISNTTIVNLLQTLKQPKPVFKPEYISFNLNEVIKKIDSVYFKGEYNRYTASQQIKFIGLLKNKKITNKAVTAMQSYYATDYDPLCGIYIIKNNNDTLKIESYSQLDFGLPWEVNGVKIYNTGFSRFFIATSGNFYASQKIRLSGEHVYSGIYDYIQTKYANDFFERERIQEVAPANVALLKRHFAINKIGNLNGDRLISLQPNYAKPNVFITSVVNITDENQLRQLISFSEDTLARFLKQDNFIIKRCLALPGCKIDFGSTLKSSYNSLYTARDMDRTGYLRNYSYNDIVHFTISNPNTMFGDEWLYLPDGKIVLYGYIRSPVTGLEPGKIKISNDYEARKSFVVFDKWGNVIKDFTDL